MGFALLLINVYYLYYFFKKNKGIYLSYVLFFQEISFLIFSDIGFSFLRYPFLAILTLIYVIRNTKLDKYKFFIYHKNILYLTLLLFIFTVILHHIIGINSKLGQEMVVTFYFRVLPLILIILYFVRDKNDIKNLGKGFLFWGIFSFFVLILISDVFSLSFHARHGYRLSLREESGINPITWSLLYCSVFIISLIYYINEKATKVRLYYLIVILISVIAILLSGSRGPVIAMIVAMMVYSYYYLRFKSSFNSTVKYFILITFFISFIIYMDSIIGFGFIDRITTLGNYKEMPRYTRLQLFIVYLQSLPLLGVGPGGFYYLTGGISGTPHNIVVELILDYGLIGLVVVVNVIFFGFLTINRLFNKISYQYQALMIVWIMYLVSSMFSRYLLGNRELWLFLSIIILINYFSNKGYLCQFMHLKK